MVRIPVLLLVIGILMTLSPAVLGAQNYIIAYESEVEPETYDIFLMQGVSGAAELAYENARHPSLTTEGTLFFTQFEVTLWGDYWKAYYISYRGIEEITTNTIFTEQEPSISRDGQTMVISSTRSDTSEIIFVPLSISEPTVRITQNNKNDIEPALDGTGETIYYTVMARDESYIYRVGSDGYGQERISVTGSRDRHPSINADNTMLAFSSERDGNSEIYVLNFVENSISRLTDYEGWDGNPCISSDGEWVVFTSDRDGNKEIYAIKSDGSDLTRITENEIPDDNPALN